MSKEKKCCGNCGWWMGTGAKKAGQCRYGFENDLPEWAYSHDDCDTTYEFQGDDCPCHKPKKVKP